MDAHFKLLARVFVDEGRAVDRVLFNFGRERYRARYFRVVAKRGLDNLLYRRVEHLVLVSADFNAEALRRSFCFGLARCAGLLCCWNFVFGSHTFLLADNKLSAFGSSSPFLTVTYPPLAYSY